VRVYALIAGARESAAESAKVVKSMVGGMEFRMQEKEDGEDELLVDSSPFFPGYFMLPGNQ
jgi:hypothetical protein